MPGQAEAEAAAAAAAAAAAVEAARRTHNTGTLQQAPRHRLKEPTPLRGRRFLNGAALAAVLSPGGGYVYLLYREQIDSTFRRSQKVFCQVRKLVWYSLHRSVIGTSQQTVSVLI